MIFGANSLFWLYTDGFVCGIFAGSRYAVFLSDAGLGDVMVMSFLLFTGHPQFVKDVARFPEVCCILFPVFV